MRIQFQREYPHAPEVVWQALSGGHKTAVTYELETSVQGGTRLKLTHDGFKGLSGLFLSVMLRFGWNGLVKKLLPEMSEHIARYGFSKPFPRPTKATQVGEAHARMQAE